MSETLTESEPSGRRILRFGDPVRFTSRVAVWGTLAGLGTGLAAPVLGTSPILWFVAGAGAILGGLGTVALSTLILARRRVRLTWKIGGFLGIPFGLSLGALGILRLFVLPSVIATGGSIDPRHWMPFMATLVVVGVVLALLVGTDVLRFMFRGQAGRDIHTQGGAQG